MAFTFQPLPAARTSMAFTALDPMSSPTRLFCLPRNENTFFPRLVDAGKPDTSPALLLGRTKSPGAGVDFSVANWLGRATH
jgi:hypothetical protein